MNDMAYFYLACFMMCYVGALGLQSLSNGWLIKYGEKKRRIVRNICFGFIIFPFIGTVISSVTDIFL